MSTVLVAVTFSTILDVEAGIVNKGNIGEYVKLGDVEEVEIFSDDFLMGFQKGLEMDSDAKSIIALDDDQIYRRVDRRKVHRG